jgi:hypothetical protein
LELIVTALVDELLAQQLATKPHGDCTCSNVVRGVLDCHAADGH